MDALRRILLLSLTGIFLLACKSQMASPSPTPSATEEEGWNIASTATPELPTPIASPTPSPNRIKASGSVELPQDSGGFWYGLVPVPGRSTFLVTDSPGDVDWHTFQSRLALFDPTDSSLKEIAKTAAGQQMVELANDGRFVAWDETSLGSLDDRGWKLFALDLVTGDKWEIDHDSGVEFSPIPLPIYFPYLSVQDGRLAYTVLTADPSGKPAYELRVVDLTSRESTTVLGPLDAQKTSLYGVSLYDDTLAWISYDWSGGIQGGDLYMMRLPDGKPEVLDSGNIGVTMGAVPVLYKNNVIYDKGADDTTFWGTRLIYVADLETGEKRQISENRQILNLYLADRFAYWPDSGTDLGVLFDLQTGKAMSLGPKRIGHIFIINDKVFWVRVDDNSKGPAAYRDYLEWADLSTVLAGE